MLLSLYLKNQQISINWVRCWCSHSQKLNIMETNKLNRSEIYELWAKEEKYFEKVKEQITKVELPKTQKICLQDLKKITDFDGLKKYIANIEKIEKEQKKTILKVAFENSLSLSKKSRERFANYLRVTSFLNLTYTNKETELTFGKIRKDNVTIYYERNERNDITGLLNAFKSARIYMQKIGFNSPVKSTDKEKERRIKTALQEKGLSEVVINSAKDLKTLCVAFGVDFD